MEISRFSGSFTEFFKLNPIKLKNKISFLAGIFFLLLVCSGCNKENNKVSNIPPDIMFVSQSDYETYVQIWKDTYIQAAQSPYKRNGIFNMELYVATDSAYTLGDTSYAFSTKMSFDGFYDMTFYKSYNHGISVECVSFNYDPKERIGGFTHRMSAGNMIVNLRAETDAREQFDWLLTLFPQIIGVHKASIAMK